MNACYTTGLMQQFPRLFGVLVLSLFSFQMAAYAAPEVVGKKTLRSVLSDRHADTSNKVKLLMPSAYPAALPANSGKIAVLFSIPLVQEAGSLESVYLRQVGDKERIAMNDFGKDGDFIANDGIYGVSVQINTDKVKPDTCLSYVTYIEQKRAEHISRPLRLCVSSLPVGIAESDISKPANFSKGTKAVADEILINVLPSTNATAIRELASSINAIVVGSILPLNFYQLKLSSPASANRLLDIVAQLKTRKGVVNASINALGQGALDVNDTAFDLPPTDENSQHGLKRVIAHIEDATNANAWDAGFTGNGVTVVVLDTGLESSHSDLDVSWTCQDVPPAPLPTPVPVVLTPCSDTAVLPTPAGHGTQIAGIIAAKTNNGLGVAGVAFGSAIHAIKMRNFTTAGMIGGLKTAAGYLGINGNAEIVNASFNVVDAYSSMDTLCGAVESVVWSSGAARAIVVNSAGNEGQNTFSYPARCNDLNAALIHKELLITVSNSVSFDHSDCGLVGNDNRCAAKVPADPTMRGSNFGAWVDIAAPGSVIRTTTIGNTYTSTLGTKATGTSFSAPMVAGAVALLRSCTAPIPLSQIKSTLTSSASVLVSYPLSGANPAGSTPLLNIHRAFSYQAPTSLIPIVISINEGNAAGATVATLTATDPDICDKLTFTLVAGAGSADNGAFTITGNQLTINSSANYETKLIYNIRVRVTDFGGLWHEQALTVNVNNINDNPPVITSNGGGATASISVSENTTAVTTVTATDADILGPLSYTISGTDAGMFNIHSVTGVLTFAVTPNFENPDDVGADNIYNLVVQASDGTYTNTQAITVTVTNVNEAPVANNDTLAANQNTAVTFAAALMLGNDTDVDAGTTLTISSVTSGAGGTAVLNGDGSVTFTPNPGFSGPANFTYRATDGSLLSNVATVTVNVSVLVNHAPVAINDTLGATEDIPAIYTAAQLLGNDTDVDVGTTLSIASVASGVGGTAVLNGDGTVTFSPNTNFNGVANFTYTATDGGLTSNVATVTVNVAAENDVPTGLPFISGTRTVGQTLTANTLTGTFPNPIFDADVLGAFSYVWQASSLPVGGNSDTYVLASTDFGKFMRVCVSYTDGGGTPEERCSATDTTAVGDPHIFTVDGLRYDFQGAGEFVALRGANGMEIQLRMAPVPSAPPLPDDHTGLTSGASVNTAVAARVGKHSVSYQPDTSANAAANTFVLRVDGVPKALPLPDGGIDLGDGGRVISQAEGLQIDFPDQTTLMINNNWGTFYGAAWLHINVFHTSAYDGIMGARSKDSWLPRLSDGSSFGAKPASLHDRYVELYVKFADSWRVNKDTTLFYYDDGTSTATFTNKAWPTENGPYTVGNEPVAKPLGLKAAQLACRDVVGKNENANCIFDVRVLGHADLAKGHLLNQKIRLGAVNVVVRGADKLNARGEMMVTATVARHATVVPKMKGLRNVPAGTVQFMLGDKPLGKPVKLDEKGQAKLAVSRMNLERFNVGKLPITARYLPVRDKANVFLPSISRQLTRELVGLK